MQSKWNVTVDFLRMIAVLAVAIFSADTAYAQTGDWIVFQRERIRIWISADRVRVKGEYTLANKSSSFHSVRLFYPLPVDSLHPFPRNVSVTSGKTRIPFITAKDGVYFTLEFSGRSSISTSVSYDQQCLVPNACYILKSTASWQTPLERADFRIRVAPTIELKSMSYSADQVRKDRGTLVLSFTRKRFMPVKDLCFEWVKKREGAK